MKKLYCSVFYLCSLFMAQNSAGMQDALNNAEQETPLHTAIVNGNTNAATFLLKQKKFDVVKNTKAAEEGFQMVEEVAEPAVDINAADAEGMTALHLLASNARGRISHLRKTLERDTFDDLLELIVSIPTITIDARDKSGRTPLHHAVENEEWPSVIILLEHGANVNAESEDHQFPIDYLLKPGKKYSFSSHSSLRSLLAHGASLVHRGKNNIVKKMDALIFSKLPDIGSLEAIVTILKNAQLVSHTMTSATRFAIALTFAYRYSDQLFSQLDQPSREDLLSHAAEFGMKNKLEKLNAKVKQQEPKIFTTLQKGQLLDKESLVFNFQ